MASPRCAIKSLSLIHISTTIVNTDDAIPGSGMFVRSSIESNKQLYPWSQFILRRFSGRPSTARMERQVLDLLNSLIKMCIRDSPSFAAGTGA